MTKFNLIFAGEISDGFELEDVKQNFQKKFHLTEVQTKYVFSGKEIILKRNLTQEKALEFALSIDDIGGVSYFEPISEVSLPPGVTEDRRKGDRRKRQDRRKGYRAGINADRRINSDRRKNN